MMILTTLWLALSSLRVVAEGPAPVPFTSLSIEVVTAEGQPVENALVTPWAIGGTNGHGRWIENRDGPAPIVSTSSQGVAQLPYPEIAFEKQPTQVVSVHVAHPEFCPLTLHLKVGPAGFGQPPHVELQPGTRIRLHVQDRHGQPVTDGLYFQLSAQVPPIPLFTLQEDGSFLSYALKDDWTHFRVLRIPETGPTEFSPLMKWNPHDEATWDLTTTVRPGVRLTGVLDESVPRPVIRGRACVFAADPSSLPDAISWSDTVGINQNGEFTFESLPRDVDLQVSGICQGHLSSDDTKDRLQALADQFPRKGPLHFGSLKFSQVVSTVDAGKPMTLRMEPAAEARIKVIDSNGSPAENVVVGFWPNIYWIGGGSTHFAPESSTQHYLLKGKYDRGDHPDFIRMTDAEGVAWFRSLPPGREEFYVGTRIGPKRELTVSPKSPALEIDGQAGKTAELTIQLDEPVPKP
ncbi:MAG: hypothetical protein ACK5Q5_03810 [Planctomycetaceae bacterium]